MGKFCKVVLALDVRSERGLMEGGRGVCEKRAKLDRFSKVLSLKKILHGKYMRKVEQNTVAEEGVMSHLELQ